MTIVNIFLKKPYIIGDMILTIIGNNIRRLRKEKGLRQIDLAIAVGIDSSYLSEIENKKRNPTILLLDNIATVLEVSLIELLSDNQHKD